MSELAKNVWGPHVWSALHVMSAASDAPQAVRRILENLREALPCPECRVHYAAYLDARPPTFETTAEAAQYVFDFHNAVNSRLGKPLFSPRDFAARYEISVKPSPPATTARPVSSLAPAAWMIPGLIVPGLGVQMPSKSYPSLHEKKSANPARRLTGFR